MVGRHPDEGVAMSAHLRQAWAALAAKPKVTVTRFNDGGMLGRPIVGGDYDDRRLDNWAIDLDGQQVGVVQVFAPTKKDPRAVIAWINVREEHRRKGVASEVYKLLSQQYPKPVSAESFTDLGKKWWKGMGKNPKTDAGWMNTL